VRQATICKEFRFEAAHQLPNHDGKCARLHGHSYRVEVRVAGPIADADGSAREGMVMDFARVKEAWEPIGRALDHQNLNDLLDFPTTAENLAWWMLDQLTQSLPAVQAVRVWETAAAWAEATV
jgi:6-pyruvoyltetrahydropterin/6-carboxytetrahydropterin synthase